MKAPVETVNKRTEVTGSVFGEIERMVSAAQTGLEVAKNRIDPVEFWQILRLATVRDDCPVLAEPASVTPAKQLNPSEVTIQSGARLALAQPETALRVKPGTGAILIYRGTAFGTERDGCHKRNLVLGTPACLAASQFSAKVSIIRLDITT